MTEERKGKENPLLFPEKGNPHSHRVGGGGKTRKWCFPPRDRGEPGPPPQVKGEGDLNHSNREIPPKKEGPGICQALKEKQSLRCCPVRKKEKGVARTEKKKTREKKNDAVSLA